MAKQDLFSLENEDRGKRLPLNEAFANAATQEAITPANKIKNAHATGTGAMGCPESSIKEEEENNQPGKAY